MSNRWRRLLSKHIHGRGLYVSLFVVTSILFWLIVPFDESVTASHGLLFMALNALFWGGVPALNTSLTRRWIPWVLIGTWALGVQVVALFMGGQTSLFYYLYYPVIFYTALMYGFSGVVPLLALITLLYGVSSWGRSMDTFVVRSAQLALGGLMLGFLSEEKRNVERRLGNYAERLINSIGSGMIVTDAEGYIQSLNRAAEEILGYTTGELKGRQIDREVTIHSEGFSPLWDALTEELNQDRIDTTLLKKSGESMPAGVSVYLLEEDGKTVGAVEIFRDLTEIKAREAQIERQRRLVALGSMAAEVAHEVRNPLGGVKGFASLLARRLEDETSQRYVNKIIEGVESIERVVNDFLLYARPVEPRFRLADLHQLLDTCLMLSLEQNESIQVERDYGEDVPKLAMDPEQMRQVFMNLMVNAEQAMPEGGTFTIKTRLVRSNAGPKQSREVVQITFADTGVGIPREVRDRIFDPFFTTKDTGTGLGLAIVHRIVEAHHGTITVQSNGECGALFVLELPVQSLAATGKYEKA